ncbi:MAG: hypothetical protein PHH54_02435 [Candidatus Nanoarchaeia archaeon]|nr:hypothetical protein [Candidatus Nanoarchaeia archaeon]MDD5740819.1 hypothetical protein [Candidatus Nanoarchaeia archaeon]
MKQFIFPFSIESFKEIENLVDGTIKDYIIKMRRVYKRALSQGDCSNPDDILNQIRFVSGERLIRLVDNCPYKELTHSPLFDSLRIHFESYRQ